MLKKTGLLIVFSLIYLSCAEVRPIRDEVGFCWDRADVEKLINYLKSTEKKKFNLPVPVAGISPHDDYLYAGKVYYPLFKNIRAKEIVIFGVTHGSVRKKTGDPQNKLIFDEYMWWSGPYINVKISPLRDFLKDKLDKKYVMISNNAHNLEHSIEAMIPFLQYFNRNVKITPIMVTGMNFEKMEELSEALSSILLNYIKTNGYEIGKDIFFLISADANHYGGDFNNSPFGEDRSAHKKGTGFDKKIIRSYLTGEVATSKIRGLTTEIWGKTYKDPSKTLWCGRYSIPFGLLTVIKVIEKSQLKGLLTGKLLRYSDTYSEGVLPLKNMNCGITAPFSFKHWVGFFSAAFYMKQ